MMRMTSMAGKRILSLLLALCLVGGLAAVGLGSLQVSAADAKVKEGGQLKPGDTVYYGAYYQLNGGSVATSPVPSAPHLQAADRKNMGVNTYFVEAPIQWHVLDTDNGEIFLLAKDMIEFSEFSTVSAPWDSGSNTLRVALNSTMKNAFFSGDEQQSLLQSTLPGSSNPKKPSSNIGSTQDEVFLLSYEEVNEYFPNAASRVALNSGWVAKNDGALKGSADRWALRTPGNKNTWVMSVQANGSFLVEGGTSSTKNPIRPAIKLDADKIVLVSEEGGKPALDNAKLSKYGSTSGPLKLTLINSGMTLASAAAPATAPQNGTAAVTYSGTPGAADYLSCVLSIDGQVKYYGKLEAAAGTGTVNMDLTGVNPGKYKARFFYEDINAGGTDFASNVIEQDLLIESVSAYIATDSLPNGKVGQAYAGTGFALNVVGSPAPTVTVTGLPAGLTYSGGAINGTPSQVGTFNVTIKAANPTEASKTLPLVIETAAKAPEITTADLADGFLYYSYSSQVQVSAETTSPYLYSISAGALPSGLTIEPNSGMISGSPTSVGTFTFTVKVTNSVGSATRAYTVEIKSSQPEFDNRNAVDGVVGAAYTHQIFAHGVGTITYTEVTSTLAGAGLAMDTAGNITGIPTTTGTVIFKVKADNGLSTFKDYQIKIVASGNVPAAILGSTLPDAYVGESYSYDIPYAGNPAPDFSQTSMPTSWLSLEDTGVDRGKLTGTPPALAVGDHTFEVTVDNGDSTPVTQEFTLTVHQAPVFTTTSLPNATASAPYSQTIAATGNGAMTFTDGGTLPSWLSLNGSTGEISGTPAAAGSDTFTITATDIAGRSTNGTFTIIIDAAGVTTAPVISTASLPDGVEGVAYSRTIAATGTPAPAFSLASGTLPGGLSLNTATGVISGTPTTAETKTFTIRAANGTLPDATKSYTMTILPAGSSTAPQITTSSLSPGTVGAGYSETFTATGTPAPDFTVSGTLPPGITFDGTATISGTPTAAGSYPITVTATSPAGSNSANFTIVINSGGVTPPGPAPSSDPEVQTITPDPMRIDLNSSALEGYVTISLGSSNTAAKAVATTEGGNTNAVDFQDNPLTSDGHIRVRAKEVGTTTVRVSFYDALNAHMPAYDHTFTVEVVNSYRDTNKDVVVGSKGGGGGGGSYRPKTNTAADLAAMEARRQEDLWDTFIKEIPAKVDQAAVAGLEYTSMSIRGATEITKARGQTITADAAKKSGQVKVLADTVADGRIVLRLTLDSTKVDRDIKLGGTVDQDSVSLTAIRSHFQKYYSNKMRFIYLEQQEDFGQTVRVAAKVDLTGLDTDNLVIYAYNQKANSFKRIPSDYFIDGNGFLQFDTDLAGCFIVSEGALAS